jgi:hypothetical protein
MQPLPIQPSLESFYLSLFPDLLSSWITDRFFKPFTVMIENLTTSQLDTWDVSTFILLKR